MAVQSEALLGQGQHGWLICSLVYHSRISGVSEPPGDRGLLVSARRYAGVVSNVTIVNDARDGGPDCGAS